MPDWTPQLLLVVFATHAPWFAWRYHRSGELRHAATTLTFSLLTLSYGLRVLAPEARLSGTPLHEIARVPALLAAVLSVGLLVRHGLRRWRLPAARPQRGGSPRLPRADAEP